MKSTNLPILLLVRAALCLALPAQGAADGNNRPEAPVKLDAASSSTNLLRLNFRGASLEQVLDYFSEAAGFTIVLEAKPKGVVDVWSAQPVTPQVAFELLSSVLLQNGYAAIRDGAKLTLVNRDDAKNRGIPVRLGSDPNQIPAIDEIVTQIMPVRYIEVGQLIKDLQTLMPMATVITANDSANSLVVTGTQTSVRRAAQLIQALDSGAASFTAVRVFHLKNADPNEMVEILSGVFPDSSRDSSAQGAQFGGDPPGFFGPPGGPGGGPGFGPGGFGTPNSGGGENSRLKKGARVTAVADSRTASIIVSAPKELIEQVEAVIARLDADPASKQKLTVYRLNNANPRQLAKVLGALFQNNSASSSRNANTQTDPLETRQTTQGQSQSSGVTTRLNQGVGSGGLGGGGP